MEGSFTNPSQIIFPCSVLLSARLKVHTANIIFSLALPRTSNRTRFMHHVCEQ